MNTGPTRIAFCITDLDPGGAERALVQLATRLDRTRWLPAVFALGERGALTTELEAAGIAVTCLGAKRVRNVGVAWRLVRELRRFRPELLQTFLFHANIVGRLAGRLAGVKHIVSGIRVAERRTRTHLWLDRATNGIVERNVCVSTAVAEFSHRTAKLPPEKTVVIPNGVDVARFEAAEPADLAQFGMPLGSRALIAVGRLDPQKGLQYLIEAMSGVVLQVPDLHLLLVGEGPQRHQLETWIRERRLSDRVHIAGWRSDVPNLLRAAWCLVLPSLWEGMPNVVLEAMAAGLPVIATQVEGTNELVQEGQTGLLVGSRSASALESAIIALANDPDRAERLGAEAQNHVRRHFSWEKMTEKYAELYATLIGEPVRNG